MKKTKSEDTVSGFGMKMKVAVLGAGSAGLATAAYLAIKGCRVNLYNRSEERLDSINKKGGIDLSAHPNAGVEEGFARLGKITTNLKEALEGVDFVMVTTVANGHKGIAEACVEYLKKGQTIVFVPGYGGALECARIFEMRRMKEEICIADTMTLFFSCRTIGAAQVRVTFMMNRLPLAAFPSRKTGVIVDELKKYLPVIPARDVLETALLNCNPVIHPAPTILNMATVEKNKNATSYGEVMSHNVLKCLDSVDLERRELCKALGYDIRSMDDIYYYYLGTGPTYRPLLSTIKEVQSTIYRQEERFITEDVPYGLVPWASLGDMLGVPTPTIDAVIQFASVMKDTDYWKTGMTLESLGIAGLDRAKLSKYLSEGR